MVWIDMFLPIRRRAESVRNSKLTFTFLRSANIKYQIKYPQEK